MPEPSHKALPDRMIGLTPRASLSVVPIGAEIAVTRASNHR